MGKNILAVGRDSYPTEYGLKLAIDINEEINRIGLEDYMIPRKVWKDFNPDITEDGMEVFKANSWVMEIYVNDNYREQFYIHSLADLYKISIAINNVKQKITENPNILNTPPREVRTNN